MKIAGEGLLIDTSGNATLFGALQGNINGAYRDVEAAALYTLDNNGTNVHSFVYTGESAVSGKSSMGTIMIGDNAQFSMFNVLDNNGGCVVIAPTAGITGTKDHAGTVNLYTDSTEHLTVQNLSGAAIKYALKINVGESA